MTQIFNNSTENSNSKAIIFARVSTESQDYTEQVNRMTAVAIADGYKSENLIIISNKESAIKLGEDEREGLLQLQSAIAADKSINAVYVFEISRLGRTMDVISSVVQWLTDSHIQLVCDTPNVRLFERDGSVSFGGQMMIYLMGVMAAQEMKIKKERFANGKKHAREQGKFIGGTIMYGFMTDGENKIVVNEDEATVIRTAFEMYRDNSKKERIGVEKIAQYLRDNNVCRRDKYFGSGRLNKFIKNEKYRGVIVPEDVFDECQQIIANNYNGGKEKKLAFGERLIICPDCGRHYRLTGKLYSCAGHKQEYKDSDLFCDNKAHINRQMFNCSLVETCAVWWADERNKKQADRAEDIKAQIAATELNLKLVGEKLLQIDTQKKKLANTLIKSLLSEKECEEKINALLTEEKRLQAEKLQYESKIRQLKYDLSSGAELRTWADDYNDFDSLTHTEMYEVIHKLIDKVTVSVESTTKTVWTIYRKDSKQSVTYYVDGWGKTRKLYGVVGGVAHDLSNDERFAIDYDLTIPRQSIHKKESVKQSPLMQMLSKHIA